MLLWKPLAHNLKILLLNKTGSGVCENKSRSHLKMKSVLQNYFENVNAKVAMLSGIIGGMFKYFLQVNNSSFFVGLSKAAITALICAVAGLAGKELYAFCKRRILKKMALKIH